jgi:hypothetical protein
LVQRLDKSGFAIRTPSRVEVSKVNRPKSVKSKLVNLCRGAATSVLAGWYLMVPPSIPPGSTHGYKRPLSQWRLVQAFDTADQCEDFKSTFFDSSRQQRTLGVLDPANRNYMFADCFASDDPRLKPR